MRVGLITTIRTNPGDDLIRTGILRLLRDLRPGEPIEAVAVNKHHPETAWSRAHPARLVTVARRVPRVGGRAASAVLDLAARVGRSRFAGTDLIVQCGAPVLFPGCHAAEFSRPGWEGAVAPLADRIPVLNLAAGSCYPWERPPDRVPDPRDAAYLDRILALCRLTTARDRLAARLARSLGHRIPVLPCTALLAGPETPPAGEGPEILVSYMEGAGHFGWDQGIDAGRWRETARAAVARLARRFRVAFLCHDAEEEERARRLVPDLPRHRPRSVREYAALASAARAGLCNRMHASVMLAGMGVPSVAVGTDTRLAMVEETGLPARYVKDVGPEELADEVAALAGRADEEQERLIELRRRTRAAYLDLLSGVLS